MRKSKCLKIIYLVITLLILNISSVSAKNYEVYKDDTLVIEEGSSIEGNVQIVEGADKITVSFNSKTDDKKITIRGKAAGEAKIKYKRKNKGGTLQITHTIKVILTEEQQEEQNQEQLEETKKEKEEYENAYKTIPAKDAVAKDIKEFILSDEKNNSSKALKQVAETDKDKIQAWYDTVVELIKTDRHYALEDQYGSTKNKLKAILDSYDSGTSVDDAVDSVDTSGAAELVEESYWRLIAAYSTKVTGNRETSTFDDILDNIDGYNKPDDLDSETSNKIGAAANKVLTAIMNIGMVAAVLMIAILGIKYMLGGVEEKAEYKKDLVPYLIGACLLFGISAFVKIFMQWGKTLSNW